jgi:hypothetical protein
MYVLRFLLEGCVILLFKKWWIPSWYVCETAGYSHYDSFISGLKLNQADCRRSAHGAGCEKTASFLKNCARCLTTSLTIWNEHREHIEWTNHSLSCKVMLCFLSVFFFSVRECVSVYNLYSEVCSCVCMWNRVLLNLNSRRARAFLDQLRQLLNFLLSFFVCSLPGNKCKNITSRIYQHIGAQSVFLSFLSVCLYQFSQLIIWSLGVHSLVFFLPLSRSC